MGLSLKKFIKYFDDMNELLIYDWNKSSEPLFRGYTFDKGAKKKLRKLYKKYELERNDDGMAVIVMPYVNEHGAKLARVQINVKEMRSR